MKTTAEYVLAFVSLLSMVSALVGGQSLAGVLAPATTLAGALISLLLYHKTLVRWHLYLRHITLGTAFAMSAIFWSFNEDIILAILYALFAALLITIGRTQWDLWPDLKNDTRYHSTVRTLYKKENNK